jgi:phosphomannomutase
MFEHAVVAGLLAVGCQPVILGIIPTPTLQIMVEESQANGGIAITASHNPNEWNALKFIGRRGIFLNENETNELLDIYNQQDLNYSEENDYRDIRVINNAFAIHQKRIFAHINVDAIIKRRFKVALDCCNGVGALFSRHFLEALGCEVYSIFDSPSGIFERTPEPIADNLTALEALVKSSGAIVGFAHDPDGDRMAVVDNNGNAIGEQYTLVLAVYHLLAYAKSNVVANVQTTKILDDVVSSYGCSLSYSKVGEIHVVEKMLETNADIGGEGNSGGVIWNKIHPGRDGYVAMALILEMLAMTPLNLDDIIKKLPSYSTKTKKIACSSFTAREILRYFANKYESYNPIMLDGLRINFSNSWVLLRTSNTESVLRLMVESATDNETNSILKQFSDEIEDLINQSNK